MSFEIKDSQGLVNYFKCCICKKFLSVLPIHIKEANLYLCGRCCDTSTSLKRAKALEEIAKCLIFPCNNYAEGCTVQLQLNNVADHENSCCYQNLKCPCDGAKLNLENNQLTCSWKGLLKNLSYHLKDCHKFQCYLANPLQLKITDFTQNYFSLYVTCFEGQIFIIYVQFEPATKLVYCFVLSVGINLEPDLFSYRLNISNINKNTIYYQKPITERWTRPLYSINDNENKAIALYVGFLLKEEVQVSLNYQITIIKTEEHKLTNPIDNCAGKKNLNAHQYILEEMECPVCNEYMVPPIYICATGHSICCNCKPKVKSCPSCKVSQISIRNFKLEEMSYKIQFPCKYSSEGCDQTFDHSQLKNHENICSYQTNCILKACFKISCSFQKKFIDNIDHIKESHIDLISDNGKQWCMLLSDNDQSYDPTVNIVDKEIFFVNEKLISYQLKFTVVHAGVSSDTVGYRYKVQFDDRSGNGLSFSISQLCQPYSVNITDWFTQCIKIPLELADSFTNTKRELFYQVIIEKVQNE